MAFYFMLSKRKLFLFSRYMVYSLILRCSVYAVSFLATLNTRTLVRGRGTDQEDPQQRDNTFYMYGQSANSRMQGTGQLASPTDELQMKVRIVGFNLWRQLTNLLIGGRPSRSICHIRRRKFEGPSLLLAGL